MYSGNINSSKPIKQFCIDGHSFSVSLRRQAGNGGGGGLETGSIHFHTKLAP